MIPFFLVALVAFAIGLAVGRVNGKLVGKAEAWAEAQAKAAALTPSKPAVGGGSSSAPKPQ